MNTNEMVAILTALNKAVSARLKEVRNDADNEAWIAYKKDCVEKRAIKVSGQKVGEIIMTFDSDGFGITDNEAFEEFALEYGLASVKRTIRPEMMESAIKALEDVFDTDVFDQVVEESVVISSDWEKSMEHVGAAVCYMDSGMVVPGVGYRPKLPKRTMVRGCTPEVVIPILRTLPGGVDALLLGGGDEK